MTHITRLLINKRDTTADAWINARNTSKERRARRKLALWDTLLGAWTNNGTRWT